jgi:Cu-Zn family superoxide dismutase
MLRIDRRFGARFRRGALAVLGVVGSLSTAVLAQTPPDSYELPGERVFPEGIAVDAAAGLFYTGSTGDGTIFRGDIASGEVTVLVEAGARPFTTIGMQVDALGRLWVAGGGSGTVKVYDTADGSLLTTLRTEASGATFINDLAIVGDHVYITDSNRPILFRAPLDLSGVEAWLSLEGTDLAYRQGINANGIAASEDGRTLVVVQTNTGALFRIDIADRRVDTLPIDEGGEAVALVNGDGLVLEGGTLYVVRNRDHEVAVVELADDLGSGTVVGRLRDDAFAFPTTAAAIEGALLVVNSQFDRMQGAPQLPFSVVRTARP